MLATIVLTNTEFGILCILAAVGLFFFVRSGIPRRGVAEKTHTIMNPLRKEPMSKYIAPTVVTIVTVAAAYVAGAVAEKAFRSVIR